MLALPISRQGFEPIARRRAQIVERRRAVQLSPRRALDSAEALDEFAVPKPRRGAVGEGLDHTSRILRIAYNVKRIKRLRP